MNIFKWLVFLIVAFIAFLPLTRMRIFNLSKRYIYFKYVSLLLFLWTIISWLEYVVVVPNQVYYLILAIYPTVYALTAALFMAIMSYLGKKVPKIVVGALIFITLAEVVAAVTNQFTHLMIDLAPDASLTLASFDQIPRGVGFFIHTVLCYSLLLVVIGLIFYKVFKDLKRDKDIIPFLIIGFGILIGIILNILHIFTNPFSIDPTYIAFVLIISLVYIVFYIRDLRLIIEFGRNEFILDNFREMYVICNHRDVVVDASDEFLETFEVDLTMEMSFDDLMSHLKEKAVVYENQSTLGSDFQEDKRYLHMLMKPIDLPLFTYQGKFYLFYDETSVRMHINDVGYVKSHDLMTQLFNRNYFEEIKKDIDKSNGTYTLIMFDLDGLKFYNDYLGHASGDNLIIRFSDKLKEIAETFEMVPIRLGGDEFLLIAINPRPKAIELAIKQIQKLSEVDDIGKKVVFSYGMATKMDPSENLERVFSKADNEMYKMKSEQIEQKKQFHTHLKTLKKKDK